MIKFTDAYTYIFTDIEIANDTALSRRMIYPKKNKEYSFEEILDMIESIKDCGFEVYIDRYDDYMTFDILITRKFDWDGYNPYELLMTTSKNKEEYFAKYEVQIDINMNSFDEMLHEIYSCAEK